MRNFIRKIVRIVDSSGFVQMKIYRATHPILIPDEPMISDAKLEFLRSVLNTDTVFVEYGTGGSTLALANSTKQIITIESDRKFLKAIVKRARELSITNVKFRYINIGPTREYGMPLPSLSQVFSPLYSRYPLAPWKSENDTADVILIDGRFRVACFLVTISMNKSPSFAVVIDDYVNRAEYRIVEKFFKPVRFVGDAAVFQCSPIPAELVAHDLRNAFKDPS